MLLHKKLRRDIGARLRAARKAAKVTLQEAGEEVGRSKQAVSAWESGESDMSVAQLAMLLTRYGATADQVVFGVPSAAAGDFLVGVLRQGRRARPRGARDA